MTRRKSKAKRKAKKRGTKDKAELPKYASVNTKIQHALNKKKANTTMTVYRHGFKLMWKCAAKVLREAKVKPYNTL